ncbi:MAG: ferrochelatase [Gemmatimonadota bacterium]
MSASAEVLLLGFGEPDAPDLPATVDFLQRIFANNARLESHLDEEEALARSQTLAERRAPGLLADYEKMGGSPLLGQCRERAALLENELAERGHHCRVRVGMQFTEPFIGDVFRSAQAAAAGRIVALPLYPLCGASTTVAALDALRQAAAEASAAEASAAEASAAEADADGAGPEIVEIAGWHTHPAFVKLVADGVREAAATAGADLSGQGTLVYFSAHGTPIRYLDEGSRYDEYVTELCAAVARELGQERHAVGFQNHSNRGIPWTEPANEELVRRVQAERLVVVPISFLHEQSETLMELDVDLRELVEELGMEMVRVPAPPTDGRLAAILADLVEPLLAADIPAAGAGDYSPCQCRGAPGAFCLSG